jgi:hypothetical protein
LFEIIRGENATSVRNRQSFALKMNVREGLGKTSACQGKPRRIALKSLKKHG